MRSLASSARGGAHAGRQVQRGDRRGAIGAGREAHVDPAQPADEAERDLRAGDVDHRERRAAGGDAAGDAQARAGRSASAAASVVAPPAARRCSAAALRKTASGSSAAKRPAPARGRGSSAGASRATTSASMPTTRSGTRLPSRSKAKVSASTTGLATATPGVRGDAAVERFVEAGARADEREVGLAVDRAHRGAELGERRGVDEMDREGERDAEHHRDQRGGVAPRMVAQLGPRQLAQQRAGAASARRCRRASA